MTLVASENNTLTDLIEGGNASQTAIILPEGGVRVSCQMFRDQVAAMADGLASLGISRGDRVASSLPNGLPAIVSFLGASIAGTAVPLNPEYREEEAMFYLEDMRAKVLLCLQDKGEAARKAAQRLGVPVYSLEMSSAGFVQIVGGPKGRSAAPPGPDDIAVVLHTSGSTGRSKRVPIRHRNITASVRSIVAHYGLSPDDISLNVMPLFHVHGLVASTLSSLASGGPVVVPSGFNTLSFWRTVRETNATWYSGVPTMHSLLLSRAREERPKGAECLRFIRSCSASLLPQLLDRMESTFGVPVIEAYGMTEAAHQMASNPIPPGERKSGSVGRATGVQIAIMDDAGVRLGTGKTGEIVIQGPSVISGYEDNVEANVKSFTNGWFRTGDQGVLDKDGYLSITGRLKELINRGGEKIGPKEIDEVLLTHPSIAEAVCFGVPHSSWGEEVAAAVVLKDQGGEEPAAPEAEILAFCRERLSEFKCPKRIYITTAIPRTATGKIQRAQVARSVAGV